MAAWAECLFVFLLEFVRVNDFLRDFPAFGTSHVYYDALQAGDLEGRSTFWGYFVLRGFHLLPIGHLAGCPTDNTIYVS